MAGGAKYSNVIKPLHSSVVYCFGPSTLSIGDICLQTKTTLGLIAFHNYCHTLNTGVVDGDN